MPRGFGAAVSVCPDVRLFRQRICGQTELHDTVILDGFCTAGG